MGGVELEAELAQIAAAASELGDDLAAVIPTEPEPGRRVYLCGYETEPRSWLALDADGTALSDRSVVRAAVSVAALAELAEESAGGGKLEDLRRELVALRVTEAPEGIEEAEEAALALERTIGAAPRVASPEYLDAVGLAARRLEQALGEHGSSPFAEAMKHATPLVSELESEVLAGYRGKLS